MFSKYPKDISTETFGVSFGRNTRNAIAGASRCRSVKGGSSQDIRRSVPHGPRARTPPDARKKGPSIGPKARPRVTWLAHDRARGGHPRQGAHARLRPGRLRVG